MRIAVGKVDLPYVHAFVDRQGKLRCYFRYRGKRWPLPAPDAPEFPRAYRHLCERIAGKSATPNTGEAALGWLIQAYQASPEFKSRAPSTQVEYRRILSDIGMEHGRKEWARLTPGRVMEHIRDPLAETPRKADTYVSVLSAVYSWAKVRQIVKENPCAGVPRLYRSGEGYRAWTAQELATFAAGATDLEFLIFALALYTGQRVGDLVKMTWFQYDGAEIRLTQGKTRRPLRLSVHPSLRTVLDGMERNSGTILAQRDGRPYARSSVSKIIEKACRRMGLVGVCLHGLRTTHATILADAGVSSKGIAASTGHRRIEMVEHYTRGAEQARLARDGIARLPDIVRKVRV